MVTLPPEMDNCALLSRESNVLPPVGRLIIVSAVAQQRIPPQPDKDAPAANLTNVDAHPGCPGCCRH
jgi:hypothetical protein